MISKYRAWLIAEKQMVEVEDLVWSDGILEGIGDGITFWRSIEDVILMQSIGRKDIKDIDIFCDDIVKDFQGNLFLVKYWVEYSSYFLSPVDEPNTPMGIYPDISLEVIGNIFENPELVKVKG